MRVAFTACGSTPCHGQEIVRYGGNTSCVSVDVPGHKPVVFDLGTGLRYFGQTLSSDEPLSATCLLSHLHWDHIQGRSSPLLRNGSDVHIYAPVQEGDLTVEQVFADTIKPPLFPIHFSMLPGMINFHEVWDDEFMLGDDLEVMSRSIPHRRQHRGLRLTWKGTSITYMSDHQMPVDGSFAATQGALDLCRGADLLIHDAVHASGVRRQEHVGSLHRRVRGLARRVWCAQARTVPSRSSTTTTSWTSSLRRRPTVGRRWVSRSSSREGLIVEL